MAKYEVVVFETLRYTKVVEAKDEDDAKEQVFNMETDEMDKDNEYYESDVADVRKVSDG
jgi:cupin superfamily acireductone dioxygenase involved in methionine salvage